jgi:hypothetical protein
MEALSSSEMSVLTTATQLNITEDAILHWQITVQKWKHQNPVKVDAILSPRTPVIFTMHTHYLQAQCASLRITDCGQLLREASREDILRDDICTAQCGFLLQDDSSVSPDQDNADIVFTTTLPAPMSQHSQSRNLPTALVPPLPAFQSPPRRTQRTQLPNMFGGGFRQLPDFSRFLG